MRRMKRFQIAHHGCLLIKYHKDTRYSKDGVSSHDRQSMPARSASVLADLTEEANNFSVIGIDEGQFVRPDCQSR